MWNLRNIQQDGYYRYRVFDGALPCPRQLGGALTRLGAGSRLLPAVAANVLRTARRTRRQRRRCSKIAPFPRLARRATGFRADHPYGPPPPPPPSSACNLLPERSYTLLHTLPSRRRTYYVLKNSIIVITIFRALCIIVSYDRV